MKCIVQAGGFGFIAFIGQYLVLGFDGLKSVVVDEPVDLGIEQLIN